MLFFKDVNIEEVFAGVPEVHISEAMVKRDNFFHSCWTLLKKERRDLWDAMNRIELILAGYDPDEQKEEQPDENEETKKSVIL